MKPKREEGVLYKTWGDNASCRPEVFFEPETTEQIKQILDEARNANKKVRVVGAGHSLNDITMTSDYMVSLKKYNKLLNIDKEHLQVTVQAGALLSQLNNEILPQAGLALSVMPAIDNLSVAGLISTGSHGTGAMFPSCSAFVVAMELMTSSGDVIKMSETENPDLLPAAKLSLGCFGVILNITLQCEPAFNLHEETYGSTVDQFLSNLDELSESAEHFKFSWMPYTDCGWVTKWNRTDRVPMKHRVSRFWALFAGVLVSLIDVMNWIGTKVPKLLPFVQDLYYRGLFKAPKERVDRSDKMFTTLVPWGRSTTEWCVPRHKALDAFREFQQWSKQLKSPVHFPVDIRFSKQDDMFLSPAYKRDVCYINIVLIRPFGIHLSVQVAETFDAFASIMIKHGGVPHWGKVRSSDFTKADMRRSYPEWKTFDRIRRKLDPTGMFSNDFVGRYFDE